MRRRNSHPVGSVTIVLMLVASAGCSSTPTQRPASIPQASPVVTAPSAAPEPLPTTIPTTQPGSTEPRSARRTLGKSVEGRPIEMVQIGTGPSAFLILAGLHGDEPTGCYVAEHLVGLLAGSVAVPENVSVFVVTCANPDGRESGKRGNAHGVDLNRNFPASNWRLTRPNSTYGGAKPASEPETVAVMEIVRELHPALILSIHSIRDGRQCNNYDGPATRPAELMGRYNGYPVEETIGYPTPGSLGSWAGKDLNFAVITLELPREQSGERAWSRNRDALLAVIGIEPGKSSATQPAATSAR